MPLSTAVLRQKIACLPRLPLAHLPTPLEELPRFSQAVGGPRILIKRDDCTGLLMGGNKTRHNEFLLARAVEEKADVVVWGAGTQSNNCRQTAAGCAKLGLECRLFLTQAVHNADIQGNLLLDHLMGAQVTIVDAPMGPELDDLLHAEADKLRKEGRRPFVWDRAAGRPLAAVSYALCLAEIQEQLQARDIQANSLYCAAAGATGGGLLLGKAALGWPGAVKLLSPIVWPWNIPDDMAQLAAATGKLIDVDAPVLPRDVDVRTDFIGPRYGAVTPAGRAAMDLLARTEGILLDPVYTAKAMAALIHDVRQGLWGKDDTVVFLHTGGTPAVFAYRDELMQS